jgi:long-chain acyl-CoA synthetase
MNISCRPATYAPVTIAGGIRAAAGRTPKKPALGLGAQVLTYARLVERISRVGNAAAHDLRLAPGDRAGVLAPNCLEMVELVCGLSEIGAIAVLINPRLAAGEIEYILQDSGARVLFVHPSLENMARGLNGNPVDRLIVTDPRYEEWLAKAAATRPRTPVEEWDNFAMHYTAGTTGKAKGVLISHRSRVLTFFGMASEYGCYGPDDRALGVAPMFHGAGLAFSLAPIFFGGYCEIVPRFDPEHSLRLLADKAISNVFLVPTHFHAMFRLSKKVLARYRKRPGLRTVISNAAPLPQATKTRIVEYFGAHCLHETYGSTEGGIVSNLRPADQLRKEQCVGLPFPCTQIRLLDEQGNEVSPGEVGELFSRSPYLFNGYWERPEASAEAFRDGSLTVGDLARHDEEGYLYLVDRKKDLIISGGINIYPREIEECLHAHPAVAEVAVVGVSDAYWGESIKAYVVRLPNKPVNAEELLRHCEGKLARYKLPKSFSFLDALPRNAAGKILKRELRTWQAHNDA